MIVCKIYVDVIDGEDCIITELAKRNIPQKWGEITNIRGNDDTDNDDNFRAVYIYSTTYVAISKEAKELLYWLLKNNWEKNIFLADYTFEIYDYDKKIGTFCFLPEEEEGNTQRKKIFYVNKRSVYIDSEQYWTEIMESMPVYDNEFLKNLDLTEPVEI